MLGVTGAFSLDTVRVSVWSAVAGFGNIGGGGTVNEECC